MQPYLNIFLSTLSLRRATRYASQTAAHMIFLSTLSLRRATNTFRPSTSFTRYFYPRSPCGERHAVAQHGYNLNCNFYPRSPCGERRGTDRGVSIRYGFLSTLSLRRATQIVLTLVSKLNEFLSTLSLRRATIARCLQGWHKPISIHALLAESDLLCAAGWAALKISIHALLAESDRARAAEGASARNFYPRSPCGERRALWGLMCCTSVFLSTLSLRRATYPAASCRPPGADFYPRSPCGERLVSLEASAQDGIFLSTLSLRRATQWSFMILPVIKDFYPRSPCGERLEQWQQK